MGSAPESLRVLVIIEEGEHTLAAYAPDVPGCVVTARTRDLLMEGMREALQRRLGETGGLRIRSSAVELEIEPPTSPA